MTTTSKTRSQQYSPPGCRHQLLVDGVVHGKGCANPGLALERYLKDFVQPSEKDERSARALLLETVATTQISASYRQAYQRWHDTLRAMPNVLLCQLSVPPSQRLIVGLGSANVLEISVTLNRIYGVPMIPGSALKGLARHYFTQQIADSAAKADYVHDMFGSTESASFITYFDAWYIPGPDNSDCPLQPDILTPHHQKYYGRGASYPTDFDDPIPVSFLSAIGSYLVALQGPSTEWTKFTFSLLQKALAEYGIGGKTSSGYGRLNEVSANRPESPCTQQEEETWRGVRLVFTPNNGKLEVRTSDLKRASAKLTYLSLPEETVKIVKQKKSMEAASITVKHIGGNYYHITRVTLR